MQKWGRFWLLSLEIIFLAETERWVAQTREGLLFERTNPCWAEVEVPADFFVCAREAVVESDTLGEDVCLTLGEPVDRFQKRVYR